MTLVPLRRLLGVGTVPSHRTTASEWCRRLGISTEWHKARGGKAEHVCLSDLPEDVRRAYAERLIEEAGLPPGTYDEAAHERLLAAPPATRAAAQWKAEIACFMLSLPEGMGWKDRVHLTRKRFGTAGTAKPTLRRVLVAVKGVDPVNFAPALMGFLSPAMKDWALGLCRSDEASFDLFLASVPPAFAHLFKPSATGGRPPSAEGASAASPLAEAVCAQLGLAPGRLKD